MLQNVQLDAYLTYTGNHQCQWFREPNTVPSFGTSILQKQWTNYISMWGKSYTLSRDSGFQVWKGIDGQNMGEQSQAFTPNTSFCVHDVQACV